MNQFIETLTSKDKCLELPEEYDYFGKLIGSWKLNYTDRNISCSVKGEWHFSWVLEGMAVQDVIVLPGFEYGTTLRVYNPGTHAWDVSYCYTGKIMRFEARKKTISSSLQTLRTKGENGSLPKSRTIVFIGRMLR